MTPPPPPPKISVVTPTYNASAHIKECLDCVFASHFKAFEVILVDDGSTDDTLAKVSGYPCRILKNETNQGAAASRNRGAREAKGDIVLLIDSDILIPSDLVGRVWDFFEKHPEVTLLQARYGDTPYYRNLFSQYKHYIFSFRGLTPEQTYIHYVHTACVAMRRRPSTRSAVVAAARMRMPPSAAGSWPPVTNAGSAASVFPSRMVSNS